MKFKEVRVYSEDFKLKVISVSKKTLDFKNSTDFLI